MRWTEQSELDLSFVATPPTRLIGSRSRPLVLNCSGRDAAAAPGPVAYQWRHNSVPIDPTDKRYELDPAGGSLTIRRILASPKTKKRTDGRYVCLISNRQGTLAGRETTVQSTSEFTPFTALHPGHRLSCLSCFPETCA